LPTSVAVTDERCATDITGAYKNDLGSRFPTTALGADDFCVGGGSGQQGSSGEQYRFHLLFLVRD
jgi:hypothetical protein